MPGMRGPYDEDLAITVGPLRSVGADYLGDRRRLQTDDVGFNSPRLHFLHRGERQPSPVPQTRTTEAVGPDTFILRSSACRNKEGRAEESTRRTRSCAC